MTSVRDVTELRRQLDAAHRRDTAELYGVVTYVVAGQVGAELQGDHASGVDLLAVVDSSQMGESGTLQIGSDVYAYDKTTSIEDPDDPDAAETIHLTTATVNDYDDATPIYRYDPTRPGSPLKKYRHKVALVQVDGVNPGSPSRVVEAVVPHGLQDRMASGPRQNGEGEEVTVVRRHGHLQVREVHGQAPSVDTSHWDETSTPPAGPIVNAFATDPDSFAGAVPAGSIGPGKITAPIEVENLTAGGVSLGADGMQFEDANGAVAVSLTKDGVRTTGDSVVRKLVVTSGGQLGGAMSGASGGSLSMAATTDLPPPPVPPTGNAGWPAQAADMNEVRQKNRHSLAIKDTDHLWTYVEVGNRFLEFKADGTFTDLIKLAGTPAAGDVYGIAYSSVNDQIVAVEDVGGEWHVRYYSTAGVFDHEWTDSHLSSTVRRPAVGCAGVSGAEHVILAQVADDFTISLHRYIDGVYDSTTATADVYPWLDLESVAMQGALADTVFLAGDTNAVFTDGPTFPPADVGFLQGRPIFPAVSFADGSAVGWGAAAYGDEAGSLAVLDGDSTVRTWYLSRRADVLYQHGDLSRTDGQDIRVTYVDPATGDESEPSDVLTFEHLPGSQRTFTMPAPPDGYPAGLEYAVYWGLRGAADSGMFRQGATDGYVLTVLTVATSGTTLADARSPIVSPNPFKVCGEDGSVAFDGTYSNAQDIDTRVSTLEVAASRRVIDGGLM